MEGNHVCNRTYPLAYPSSLAVKEYAAKQPEEVFLSLLRTYKLMKEVK